MMRSLRPDMLAILAVITAASPAFAGSSARVASLPIAESPPAVDGRWSRFMPPEPTARYSHVAIYDPVRDRMIVIGGWDGSPRNDVWTLSLGDTPTWTRIFTTGKAPAARFAFSAIYDAVGDRIVLFGGVDDSGGNHLNDTWALTLGGEPAWSEITPDGPRPPVRRAHTAVYDPARRRMIIFGGFDGTPRNDTWALELADSGSWVEILSAGSPPPGRSHHSAVCDAARDRMIVFGGDAGSGQNVTNDTWVLSIGANPSWTHPSPSGPLPYIRREHTAILDETGERMLVFAGVNGRDDTWSLDLRSDLVWSILPAEGDRPAQRLRHVAIYDAARARMIIHGGQSPLAADDVWTLDLDETPSWVKLDPFPQRLTDRRWMPAVYDDTRDEMIVYGGSRSRARRYLGDAWTLSLAGPLEWTKLATPVPHPRARAMHAAAFDARRGRLIVIGGWNDEMLDDLWALQLGDTPTWIHLDVPGPRPTPRFNATAIYDPTGDRVILFGGEAEDPFQLFNDVWALELGGTPVWRELEPAGTKPAPRTQTSAIYDPTRHRMIVFGGQAGQRQNDVWALELEGAGEWLQLATSGTPPSDRYGHTAVCDITRKRMIVFGGNGTRGLVGDVWSLGLGSAPEWTQLAPSGSPPPPSFSHAAIYDPGQQRMLVFGGYPDGEELWVLQWSPSTSASAALQADSRARGSSTRSAPPTSLEMSVPRPNPSNAGFTIQLSLPAMERVSLRVVDIAGRLVAHLADDYLSAGDHEIHWSGADSRGLRVSAGVYFVTLRAGQQVISRTMTVL
jgi:Galactose oxidase, central domain/FlgD Ig-like domain